MGKVTGSSLQLLATHSGHLYVTALSEHDLEVFGVLVLGKVIGKGLNLCSYGKATTQTGE